MVNFHDPVVIANEARACAPRPFLLKSEYDQIRLPVETKRLLESYEWYLHADLPLSLAFCRSDMPYNSISHS